MLGLEGFANALVNSLINLILVREKIILESAVIDNHFRNWNKQSLQKLE